MKATRRYGRNRAATTSNGPADLVGRHPRDLVRGAGAEVPGQRRERRRGRIRPSRAPRGDGGGRYGHGRTVLRAAAGAGPRAPARVSPDGGRLPPPALLVLPGLRLGWRLRPLS